MGVNWRIKEPDADPLPQCTFSTAACLQAQKFGREDKDASQSSQEELQSKQSGVSERYCVWEAALGDFGMAWTWGQNSCLWPTCLSVRQ